jgi:hypothetical protein
MQVSRKAKTAAVGGLSLLGPQPSPWVFANPDPVPWVLHG